MGLRTNGPPDQWAFGPMGHRTNGPSDQWAIRPMDSRTIEPSPIKTLLRWLFCWRLSQLASHPTERVIIPYPVTCLSLLTAELSRLWWSTVLLCSLRSSVSFVTADIQSSAFDLYNVKRKEEEDLYNYLLALEAINIYDHIISLCWILNRWRYWRYQPITHHNHSPNLNP